MDKKNTNVDRCTDDPGLRECKLIFNYIIQSRRASAEESPISEGAKPGCMNSPCK